MWSGVSPSWGGIHIQSPELSGKRSTAVTSAGAASPSSFHSALVCGRLSGRPAMRIPPPSRTKAASAPSLIPSFAGSVAPLSSRTSAAAMSTGRPASGPVTCARCPRSSQASSRGNPGVPPLRSRIRIGSASATNDTSNNAQPTAFRMMPHALHDDVAISSLASSYSLPPAVPSSAAITAPAPSSKSMQYHSRPSLVTPLRSFSRRTSFTHSG